jgi:undecaprenyl-diphosphatase
MASNNEMQNWGAGGTAKLVAIVLLVCAGFITVSVASGHVFAFDDGVLLALRRPADLQHPIGPRWFVNVFENFTSLGSSAVTGLVLVIAVIATTATHSYRFGGYLVLNFAGAELLSNGIKVLVARPRPEVVPHLVDAGGFSFPSGHSTLSAATYLAIGLMIASRQPPGPRRAMTFFVMAIPIVLVGFSRLFLGVHFPTDVLGGWLIGGACAVCLWIVLSAGARGDGSAIR